MFAYICCVGTRAPKVSLSLQINADVVFRWDKMQQLWKSAREFLLKFQYFFSIQFITGMQKLSSQMSSFNPKTDAFRAASIQTQAHETAPFQYDLDGNVQLCNQF